MRFISNIPEKGMKYGAVVYYDSEYFEEYSTPNSTYYGGWKNAQK